ncbi:ATP-binding protein [Segetibacter koreensis]|uniref:DNA polymerase III subunit n=1 Tax=Segetibacter koreensis TaxID=398037 RepID=UPI000379E6D0|nr:DNA polymerase III subunit delta' [Segetibacter koreensis]
MFFKDVIGQTEVKQHLAEMVQLNRLSHALLFLGKQGSGALPLALAFGQFLVCEKVNGKSTSNQQGPSLFGFDEPVEPMNTSPTLTDACGECPACTKAWQMVHPDIHFSYPVISKKSGDKPKSTDFISDWREFIQQSPYGNVYDWLQFIGAENKQGNITAEECNDIIRQLSLKSFESEYKILLMWMPEYLGKEGNKLLKLIEEPPANTLFILVAESEEQILPTILSRTQLVKVPLLENVEVEQALIERNNTPPEQARLVAGIAQGNYHEALQLLQHSEEDWLSLLREWMNVTLKENQLGQVKWVEEAAKLGREKQKQFLRYYNHLLEQCVRLRILGPQNLSLSEPEKDFAARLNKVASVTQQQAIITELDKAAYYVERNANAKILFHALTIKMLHIIKDKVLVSVV